MGTYRKIDITISPKLITASVVEKHVCKCKMPVLHDTVPIGQQYVVDLDSVRWVRWQCAGCGAQIELRVLDVYSSMAFVPITWMFLDVLNISGVAPLATKPLKWEKVKNNQVAPKGFSRGSQLVV
jgi:hypothetical protein